MARFKGEPDFRHDQNESVGVLLVNLGTPQAPDKASLRRYLAEFLWDRRVVEVPRPLWWLILHGIILRTRPKRSAAAYRTVWDSLGEGSPLYAVGRRQRAGLEERLQARIPGPVSVALAMRYGHPSIAEGLEQLRQANARRILVLPLYPQYSGSTTGSVFDAVTSELQDWRWVPELRFVHSYHGDAGYILALADSIRAHWAEHGEPDKLLLSFHGVPKRYLHAGDPYYCHCHATARLLADELELPDDQWQMTFQSRFGREEWLRPYTDETLQELGAAGTSRVDVACPGFAADCLETLQEIDQENREIFQEAGGGEFHYIPALNDRDDHLGFLTELAFRHMRGWPQAEHWNEEDRAAEAQARLERAQARGAEG